MLSILAAIRARLWAKALLLNFFNIPALKSGVSNTTYKHYISFQHWICYPFYGRVFKKFLKLLRSQSGPPIPGHFRKFLQGHQFRIVMRRSEPVVGTCFLAGITAIDAVLKTGPQIPWQIPFV